MSFNTFFNGYVMIYNTSILFKPPFPFPPRGKGFALLALGGRSGLGILTPSSMIYA